MNLFDTLATDNQLRFVHQPNEIVKDILMENKNFLSLSVIQAVKVYFYFYQFDHKFDLEKYIQLFPSTEYLHELRRKN